MRRMFDELYSSMPWEKIDAVVFDVGQVLLTFDPPAILREYLPDQPELHPTLLHKIFRSPYWLMRDRGVISKEEAIEAMTGRDESLRPAIIRVMDSWVQMKEVISEGVETLRCCKAHGKKLYVLSNYADDAFAVVEKKYDFFQLFDQRFVSGRLKLVKPDDRIFQHVVNSTGHEPSRILFLDDSVQNVEAALHNGWQAICVDRAGKLRDFFDEK